MLPLEYHKIKNTDEESIYSRQYNTISTLCSTVTLPPFPVYTAEKKGPCYSKKKLA